MFYTHVGWQARHGVNETLLSGRLSEGPAVKEFERQLKLNENVLRYMTTRVPVRKRQRSAPKVEAAVPEEVV